MLTKERDALKRGNEKLGELSAAIKERDANIKQVRVYASCPSVC